MDTFLVHLSADASELRIDDPTSEDIDLVTSVRPSLPAIIGPIFDEDRDQWEQKADRMLERAGWLRVGPWGQKPGEPIAHVAERRGLDLVSVTEIAQRLGRTVGAIHQLRRRNVGFPEPLATLATGPVWAWSDVERWAAIPRPPGRPRKAV